jgi:hypothetical protein
MARMDTIFSRQSSEIERHYFPTTSVWAETEKKQWDFHIGIMRFSRENNIKILHDFYWKTWQIY